MWTDRFGRRPSVHHRQHTRQQAANRNAKRDSKLAAQRRRYLTWLCRTFPGTVIKDRRAVSPYRYDHKTIAAGAISRVVWARGEPLYQFVKQ